MTTRLVQRLQAVPRRLIFVDAGEPVAQQRALHVVFRRRIGACQINCRQRVIHRAIQAQRASNHRNSLRFHLRLIANGFVRGNRVENACLCSRQA